MHKYEDINYIDFVFANGIVTVPAKQVLWYSALADRTIVGAPNKQLLCDCIYLEIWEDIRGKKIPYWHKAIEQLKTDKRIFSIIIHYKDGSKDDLIPPQPCWYDHYNDSRNPFILTQTVNYNQQSSVLAICCTRHFSLLWLKTAIKALWYYITGRTIVGNIKSAFWYVFNKIKTILRCNY